MIWCEHCRDHFPEDHYDSEGKHRSGLEFGPTGQSMLLEEEVEPAAISAMILLRQLARGEQVSRAEIEHEYEQLYRDLDKAGSLKP